jgi:DnaJ family protein C protein 17
MEEENRIKEEGRKMREEAQNRAQQASKPQPMPETTSTNSKPPILPIDMTLWLQLPPDPTPTAAESSSQALQAALEARYGPISFLRLKDPAPAKKKPKGKKAILEFAEGNWGGCWACWNDHSGNGPAEKEIVPGMRAKWATVVAGGQVPEWVEWAARRKAESTKAAEAVPTFSFNPSSTSTKPSLGGGAEFESMTLLRMRQLERERLEAQIREEEQGDE